MRPQVSQEPRAALPHPAHEQKRPGLIERMIGQRQGAGREEELAPRAPAPRPAAKAPVAPPPAAPKSQVSVQSNLGIENAQRGPLPKADDDTLDIPAFLRRQAN
jgi:cell division protein FtsZ